MSRPDVVYWRMGSGVVLASYLADYLDCALERDHQGGSANAAVLRRRRPYGATGWALSEQGPWRRLAELPEAWGL